MRERPLAIVTGGSGFLGLPLLDELSSAGYRVVSVQRGVPPDVVGVIGVEADVQDFVQMSALMRDYRPSLLVHLAWTTEHGQFWNDHSNIAWIASTLRLVEAFAEHGGERFVGLGSCAEYDWNEPGPYREDEFPLRPGTLYGAAKASSGLGIELLGRSLGVRSTWVRMFYPYGPGEDPKRLIPTLIRSGIAGRTVSIREPEATIDPIHVTDTARALVAIAESELDGPVNVSSATPITISDLVGMMEGLLGRTGIAQFGDRAGSKITADASKLFDATTFEPRISLRDGVAELIEYWAPNASGPESRPS